MPKINLSVRGLILTNAVAVVFMLRPCKHKFWQQHTLNRLMILKETL